MTMIKSPWTCNHCYYAHPDPVEDPFYQATVKEFVYFCAGILLFVRLAPYSLVTRVTLLPTLVHSRTL